MPATVLKDGEVADPFGNYAVGKDQSRVGAPAAPRKKKPAPEPEKPRTRLATIGDIEAP